MIEQPRVDPPRRDWLVFVALGVLVIVLVVAALVFNRGDGEEAASTSSAAEEPTTTSASTTTSSTTTTTTTIESLSREDQIRHAAVDLIETGNQLDMNPDPARAAELYSAHCPCLTAARQSLQALIDQGHRYAEPRFDVLAVKFDSSIPGFSSVRLAVRVNEQVVVNTDGDVVERRPGDPDPAIVSLALAQDPGGRWLIEDYAILGDPPPDVLDSVLVEGLP
ncbi:MAG: hypothetical protein ACRD29_14680 [Acidimicrobiales bacterium]